MQGEHHREEETEIWVILPPAKGAKDDHQPPEAGERPGTESPLTWKEPPCPHLFSDLFLQSWESKSLMLKPDVVMASLASSRKRHHSVGLHRTAGDGSSGAEQANGPWAQTPALPSLEG